MSEEENHSTQGPDSSYSSNAPEKKSPAEKLSSPGLVVTAMLFWEAGKKLTHLFLRKSAEQPAIKSTTEAHAGRDRESRSDRDSDRILKSASQARSSWATLINFLLSLAALYGGIGFLYVYWTGGSNEALGRCLAIFFGGLALGLVINARALAVHKEATEPREPMASSPEERTATQMDFRCGKMELQRRGLLKWMTAIGLGTVAAIFVSLLSSIMPDPFSTLYSRVWKKGQRLMTLDGQPVRADSLELGSTTIVFPEDSVGEERSQTVLIRVSPQLLQLPAGRTDWAPQGNLAFSRICTHAGCPVGLYEKTAHLLMCPCHQSTFDVLRAAQPTGGPAARSLPQLPLYVDSDGVLRASGDFTTPPGPGFWGMPS